MRHKEKYPKELLPYFRSAQIEDVSGHSSATVYHLSTGYYLKIDELGRLKEEAEITRYFAKKGLGVPVLSYLSEGRDYLLTREAEGQTAVHFLDQPEKLCKIMAKTLGELHHMEWNELPGSNCLERYLDSAQSNYEQGMFYEKALLPIFQINGREEAYQLMQKNRHLLKENALIHGDFCLPNIMLKDDRFSCFIDLGLAGRSERHIDFFWAIWSLNYNLGTNRYTDCFLDQYGRENVDWEILRTISAIEAFG